MRRTCYSNCQTIKEMRNNRFLGGKMVLRCAAPLFEGPGVLPPHFDLEGHVLHGLWIHCFRDFVALAVKVLFMALGPYAFLRWHALGLGRAQSSLMLSIGDHRCHSYGPNTGNPEVVHSGSHTKSTQDHHCKSQSPVKHQCNATTHAATC